MLVVSDQQGNKMTKNVHIINADSSDWNVKILVQDQVWVSDGTPAVWKWAGEWKTVETLSLNNPGQLQTRYLTGSRRLVIEEDGPK